MLPSSFRIAVLKAALLSLWLLPGSFAIADQAENPLACEETPFPIAIEYGQHTDEATDCTIEPGSDIDRFEFAGVAGDEVRIVLRSRCGGYDAKLDIRNPLGSVVGTTSCNGNGGFQGGAIACTTSLELNLESTGGYQIAISDSGSDESGCYTLGVERLSPFADATEIAYSAVASDTILPQTDVDRFEFEGWADSDIRVVVSSRTGALDPRVEIRDPTGLEIADTQCNGNGGFQGGAILCNIIIDRALTATGVYQVFLSDSGSDETGSYEVWLECVFGQCPPDRDVACEEDAQCDDENVCTTDVCIDGSCSYSNNENSCSDATSCNGSDTCSAGLCQIHEIDSCAAPDPNSACFEQCTEDTVLCSGQTEPIAIAPGQHVVGCAIAHRAERDRFVFEAVPGERVILTVRSLTGGFDPRLELRDADGAVIAAASCNGNGGFQGGAIACTTVVDTLLASNGQFQATISDEGAEENGEYVLQLETIPPRTLPAGVSYLEQSLAGIDPITDYDFYEFALVKGTDVRLLVTSLQPGFDVRVRVRDKLGGVVADSACNGNGGFQGGAIICSVLIDLLDVESSGTYLLEISDSGNDETGGYQISLECLFGDCPFACESDEDCANDNVCEFGSRCVDQVCRFDVEICEVTPQDEPSSGDEFGRAVAGAEEYLVIGAPASLNSGSGRAHIFLPGLGGFVEKKQTDPILVPLQDEDQATTDMDFGAAVDADADTVVVGAPFDVFAVGDKQSMGSASVFVRNGETWSRQAKLVDSSGECTELGTDVAVGGDTVVLGAPGGDCVLVFERSGSTWNQVARLDGETAGARFGRSVDVSGSSILVGAPGVRTGLSCDRDGIVYAYRRGASSWALEDAVDEPEGSGGGSCFGAAVGVDGATGVIGSPGDDSVTADAGAAYVIDRDAGQWVVTSQLLAFPDGAAGDAFGTSVDVKTDLILVGAPGVAAYQFRRSAPAGLGFRATGTWESTRRYTPPSTDSTRENEFAGSVAVFGSKVILGAPRQPSGDLTDAGVVYTDSGEVETVAVCGDGAVTSAEECDDGDKNWSVGEYCNANCQVVACGDPNDAGSVTASDAQIVLRNAVGAVSCDPKVCNTNGGPAVTTSDALLVLRIAVGQALPLSCP